VLLKKKRFEIIYQRFSYLLGQLLEILKVQQIRVEEQMQEVLHPIQLFQQIHNHHFLHLNF
jgi:hypothetical protein